MGIFGNEFIINEDAKIEDKCTGDINVELLHLLKVSAQTNKIDRSWINSIYRSSKNINGYMDGKASDVRKIRNMNDNFSSKKSFIVKKVKDETKISDNKLIDRKFDELITDFNSIESLADSQYIKKYIKRKIESSDIPDNSKKESLELNDSIYSDYFEKRKE